MAINIKRFILGGIWRIRNCGCKYVYAGYEKLLEEEILERSLPIHVAIIMDGNRRYARKMGMAMEEGHIYGAEVTEKVIDWCFDIGVKQLTMYAFSMENFNRTEEEKERLFELMREEFEKISRDERIHRNEVRVKVIGDVNTLRESLKEAIRHAEEVTSEYGKFKLYIAVAYSGRREIVDAARLIGNKIKEGLMDVEDIDEGTISRHLYINEADGEEDKDKNKKGQFVAKPDVDLIIRTGGEMRLSNFIPWQALGNECAAYFCAPFWPEFRRIDFLRAIRTYQHREEEKKKNSRLRMKLIRRLS
jgi:tritrans,polycis-undecaprenyl-diphosphate synthase [geranylgeranyl-diphosphate specific]